MTTFDIYVIHVPFDHTTYFFPSCICIYKKIIVVSGRGVF